MKYLNEPWMHSMPAVTMSPNGKWLACQSMDNSIMMYDGYKYRLNKKKRFTGHVAAGYACQPAWSNDCQYIYSGEGDGNLIIWVRGCHACPKRAHDATRDAVLTPRAA